jgi:RHS repeat-associated protein
VTLTRLYQLVSGATTSRFAYDGLNALAEYNSSNALQRRWVYDPNGQPVLWYEGTGTTSRRFLSADERGSIISTSDSSGAKLAINTYDEFGNPAAGNSGRYGYTGQAWLPSVTLWYYKARVYEPQLGRFLQPDPADYSQSPNLYAYVLNDPVNLVDPFGLQPCSGDGCPRGGIQVVGQRLTFIWWPRTSYLIVERAFDFGTDGGEVGGGGRGPQYSTCTSAFAGPIYKAGGILTQAGGTGLGIAAGIVLAGGGPENPVADALAAPFAVARTDGRACGNYSAAKFWSLLWTSWKLETDRKYRVWASRRQGLWGSKGSRNGEFIPLECRARRI